MKTYHSSLDCSLHGDLSLGIDLKASVEDAVGDLVAKLVGVAFTDRLRSEVNVVVIELTGCSSTILVVFSFP